MAAKPTFNVKSKIAYLQGFLGTPSKIAGSKLQNPTWRLTLKLRGE